MNQAIKDVQPSIVELLNVVAVNITVFSGGVKREDTGYSPDFKDIYTSGVLRTIDPVHLRPFLSARQSAIRSCRQMGTRFLSGWAAANEKLPTLLGELKPIIDGVLQAKETLLSHYDVWVEEWADAHPVAKQQILARAPKRQHVERAIGASISVFKINPHVEAMASVGCADGIEMEVRGLAGNILMEISQDVADSWTPGADGATQRVRGLLNRVSEKMRSLSFIDNRLADLARFVNQTLQQLPTTGRIEGHDFLVLSGLMGILSSPNQMAHGTLAITIKEDPLFVDSGEVAATETPVVVEVQAESVVTVSAETVTAEPEMPAAVVIQQQQQVSSPAFAW